MDDVKSANQEVRGTYGAYLLGLEKNEALGKQTYTANYSSCDCMYSTAHHSCCTAEESYGYPDTCYNKVWNEEEQKWDEEPYECYKS